MLSAEKAQDVQQDDVVQVTGTVRQFVYDDYVDEYGLDDTGVYDDYAEESFLETSKVDMTADSTPPSS